MQNLEAFKIQKGNPMHNPEGFKIQKDNPIRNSGLNGKITYNRISNLWLQGNLETLGSDCPQKKADQQAKASSAAESSGT